MKPLLQLLLASLAGSPPPPASPQSTAVSPQPIALEARVHAGMELLTIALTLTDAYRPHPSPYASAVLERFASFAEHPALTALRDLGSVYPDFTEMGLCLAESAQLELTLPPTSAWYETYGREPVAMALRGVRQFGLDADYGSFRDEHADRYGRWKTEFEESVRASGALDILDAFFHYDGKRERPTVSVFLEPLNAWGAHAIFFDRILGLERPGVVAFQLGGSLENERLSFRATPFSIQTIWHEGSHVYVRPLMVEHAQAIDDLERLFNRNDLTSQNIATWDYCFNENLVRGIVAALTRTAQGPASYLREVNVQHHQRHFLYSFEIAEQILADYLDAEGQVSPRFEHFDAFFPGILELLESKQSPDDALPPG